MLMKKLFITLLAFFLLSCEKEVLKPCECEQYFTLIFENQRGYIVDLTIGVDSYKVSTNERKEYLVPISMLGSIHVKKEGVIISTMIGKPNACAKYNYFW